jgi:hypothetical protein
MQAIEGAKAGNERHKKGRQGTAQRQARKGKGTRAGKENQNLRLR